MCIEICLARASSPPSITEITPIRPPLCWYAPKCCASVFQAKAKRRNEIFSPIVAVADTYAASRVSPEGIVKASASSLLAGFPSAITLAVAFTKSTN